MSQRFEMQATPLAGLMVAHRQVIGDHRGQFCRLYCLSELSQHGFNKSLNQINHSVTKTRGTVRGLHFQYPPHAETKIVSCLRGEIFDVAVDIRADSPTFLQWHGEVLSASNHKSLCIPEGFAHGFQTLTGDCELLYLHTEAYQPDAEGALNVQDPQIAITWPLPIAELSQRDQLHPFVSDSKFLGIKL